MKRARGSRGVVALGVVAVMALVAPLLLGAGELASRLNLLEGWAWIGNADGSFVRVNGATGQVDSQGVQVPQLGLHFETTQVGPFVYITDADGNVVAFDARDLQWEPVAGSTTVVSDPLGIHVYLVDTRRGRALELDPATRAPVGEIDLDGRLGGPAASSAGDLWAPHLGDNEALRVLDRSVETRADLGEPSRAVAMSIVGDRAFAVDPGEGGVLEVTPGSASTPVELGAAPMELGVPRNLPSGPLWLGSTTHGAVLRVDGADIGRVDLAPSGSHVSAPVANLGHLYVLVAPEGATAEIVEIDAESGRITERYEFPTDNPEAVQLTVRGTFVVVNDPAGDALTIPEPGVFNDVDKGTAEVFEGGPDGGGDDPSDGGSDPGADGDGTGPGGAGPGGEGPGGTGPGGTGPGGNGPGGNGPGGNGPGGNGPGGNGPGTDPDAPTVRVPAPGGLTAAAAGGDVTVQWNPAPAGDGYRITGYRIAAQRAGAGPLVQDVDARSRSVTFRGLAPGDYTVTATTTARPIGERRLVPDEERTTVRVSGPPQPEPEPGITSFSAAGAVGRIDVQWSTADATTVTLDLTPRPGGQGLPAQVPPSGSRSLTVPSGEYTVTLSASRAGSGVVATRNEVVWVSAPPANVTAVYFDGSPGSEAEDGALVRPLRADTDRPGAQCTITVTVQPTILPPGQAAPADRSDVGTFTTPCNSDHSFTAPHYGGRYYARVVAIDGEAPASHPAPSGMVVWHATGESSGGAVNQYRHPTNPTPVGPAPTSTGSYLAGCRSTQYPGWYTQVQTNGAFLGWLRGPGHPQAEYALWVAPAQVRPCTAAENNQSL